MPLIFPITDKLNSATPSTCAATAPQQAARSPLSGAIIASQAGLPDSIVHLIATHSFEGERSYQTLESDFVRTVDIFVFNCSVKGLEKY